MSADRSKARSSPPSGPPQPHLSLTEHELFDRLGWFINVRWAAGATVFLFLFLGRELFGVDVSVGPVLAVVFLLFFYNSFFLLLVRTARRRRFPGRRFPIVCANSQLLCDLLALTVLMHFLGGVENYFIVTFVFPMVVACELLPRANAYAYAAIGSILVNAMAWGEHFGLLGHVHLGGVVEPQLYTSTLFVLKATLAMTFALFVAVFLGSSIASRLRVREQQLEEAHERLQAVDEMKSHYMQRVSHELQSPLNVVVNTLQLILDRIRGVVDENLYHVIERAEHRTMALIQLIRDLRRFAVLQTAAELVRVEPVNLARVLQETAELFLEDAGKKDLDFVLDIARDAPPVPGDREALTELCSNLISNAIRYTPRGGRIQVRLAPDRDGVELTVRDSGIGISAEALAHVFEEFYRAPNARQVEPSGTGMGLAIVKRVVELHGGTLSTDSREGQGTCFRVRLPAVAAQQG